MVKTLVKIKRGAKVAKYIASNSFSASCLYTVTGWGVMSFVYSMAFLCGSTLVKVPLLQASTMAI